MAHFAQLNETNIVINVQVVDNATIDNLPFPESEPVGIQFLNSLFDEENWKQTSYNGRFRKNYAGIGFFYDADLDAFIPPKPYQSWLLDENTCQWQSPVPYPTDSENYIWNEPTVNWVLAT
jgi:hypothetical protein